MSREPGNITLAPIKITGLPDNYCFTTIQALLRDLQTYAFAEIPGSITNVHVGNTQPTSTQRSDVWFRQNADGKFIGIYMFDGSTWKQVLPAPQQIIWMYGDSTDIPAGFLLIDNDNSHFTTPEVTSIQTAYYPTPGTPPYTIFAVTWEGF